MIRHPAQVGLRFYTVSNSGCQGTARRLSFGEESFTRFTVEMVKQYMREEETRAQHQHALLRLREKALKEKARAELAWLEQQKQRTRARGSDDVYPQIKKRQRGLLMRLQQEQVTSQPAFHLF